MHIEQIYTGCLSEAAYYIESKGEAAIIDPMRDIEPYLVLAKERNASIKYIFETHFHADFVSGHIDLSKATGAPIIYGPETKADFPIYEAKDGERFTLGDISIEAMHTPGHTLESACYLLKDETGNDYAVFTGDTLFVGDVGRPDLAQQGNELTMDDLAGMMYDSLQSKILTLADNVIVYPAHGPGSSCGKNLGPQTQSTVGEQRHSNYALLAANKEEFIKAVTDGIVAPPQYFPVNAMINKHGYDSLEAILQHVGPLSVPAFKTLSQKDGFFILDTRNAQVFTNGYVPGSISIGLEGRFAEWAGTLLPFNKTILLVTDKGQEKESAIRLARVGFEHFGGYLEGSFEAWRKAGEEIDIIIDVDADEVAMDIPFDEKMIIVDVRKEPEFADGHVREAVNIPLDTLTDPASMANINDTDNVYIHCAGGYRSVIACSLFKREGIHNIRNINGGFGALKAMDTIEFEKSVEALN